MTVHTATCHALQWNVKPWKLPPSTPKHTCNPISIPAWKWKITRLGNNLYESSHVHSLFTLSEEGKETVVSMETVAGQWWVFFCLTVWRAACWDGHWSWQSECQPIIFIAKKRKKRSRNQEKCITRGSIYAQDKCLLFGCTLHMFVETSNAPRVIFKYVDAINNKNFNFITVEMFGFMILEVLWQHYETGSALKKCIHLYFFF